MLTIAASGNKPLPASLHDRYSPQEADALALVPQVIDLVAAILGNEIHWSDAESIEATIFRALAGRTPSAAEADLLRAIFVSCVDHTPATPSSLAAITSYSGGNLLKTSLAAGITAMGEAHAGAGEGTARILLEFTDKLAPLPAARSRPTACASPTSRTWPPTSSTRSPAPMAAKREGSPATATATTASMAATLAPSSC